MQRTTFFQMWYAVPVANALKGTAFSLLPKLTTSPLRIHCINSGGGIHLRSIKNNQMLFVLGFFFFYFGMNKTVLTFSISCVIKDKTFFIS